MNSGLQDRNDILDVLNFVTDAVKSEFSDTNPSSHKSVKLSQQPYRSCARHNKPNTYLENRRSTCVTAVAPRVLQTSLFTLLQLIIGLPVLVNGCSTRSRYDQKRLSAPYRLDELSNCSEVYRGYCRNDGICKMIADVAQRAVPICSCQKGFRGRQCELINDPNIYFSRQQGQMQMAAISGAMIAIIFGSNSLSTFDTLELSSPINKQKEDSRAIVNNFEKNEIMDLQAEPSIHIQLAEKLNHPSNAFEMFTLTGSSNMEYAQHRNLFNLAFNMATKNRNMPRRGRNSIIILPDI
ncbi:unnamed protein product [Onchocerca ochengi]|uniref:EGF-like domain-containing protein n=1 Tax=Onchocerca ochengi TaxID=42157 RepID=A0A182E1B6_ONCOC|nr:unnamed protein product [Onchocerca ochengi]